MTKRIAFILLALILALLPASALAEGENAVENADFSADIDGWHYEAWQTGDAYSEFIFMEDPEQGSCVRIVNFEPNDARLVQGVPVEKDALYRFSAMVKADAGVVNLSFMNTFVSAEIDIDGAWRRVELYARADKNGTANIALRVGYYGNLATGDASFTDVRFERIEEAPAGASVHSLATNPPAGNNPDVEAPDKSGLNAMVYAGLFTLAALLGYTAFQRRGPAPSLLVWAIGAMGIAFVVRAYIAYTVPGYEVDMGCFGSWGERFLSTGPLGFYEEGYFCDYPPGYIPVLGLSAFLSRVFGLGYLSPGYQLMFKLPAILCDVMMCFVLFRAAEKRAKAPLWGVFAALLYALCPAVLADSAAWGQVDSVLTLLMALSLLAMIDRKMLRASLLFTVGVLVKPQALLFGPILALAFLHEIYLDRKKGAIRLGLCFLASAALFAAVVLPFNGLRNPAWLLDQYLSTLTSYPYATVNAMNLFALLGGNWADQTAAFFGPVSYQTFGTVMMVGSIAFSFFLYIRAMLRDPRDRRALPLCAAVMLCGIFCFGVRMHERYLFPALALVLLCFLLFRDRRLLAAFLGLAAAQAVNILIVLAHDHVLDSDMVLRTVGALLHIGSTLYLGFVAFRLCLGREKGREPFAPFRQPREQIISVTAPDLRRPGGRSMRVERMDVLLMTAVTLLYAALAFVNLGDTKAPQTTYQASGSGETLVFDLGEERDIRRFMYYGEIPSGTLSVSFSRDGEDFPAIQTIDYSGNIMFKWLVSDVQEQARYAKVVLESAGLTFFEFAFTDGEGNPYPIASVSRTGGRQARYQDTALLCDEQALVPERPTYKNSMYFDEIYHARTAYEQVHGMTWYETTHPPLGKVFLSWCIDLLGMTPFAWRLAGTLAGIFMLPGMYLLGKLLFKRRELAFAAMFLMAVDCMHLSQTRIATIDSFPVLFIIWAYFFMFLYANMSFYHEKLGRTLWPLFASGLFMGLACASKWIGFYAAAGLAVIFFYTLGKRYLEYREGRDPRFWKYTIITLACCAGFFIAIPLAIYVGSYYQYLLQPNMGNDLGGVWRYQTHMLSYHSGVFDEHAYSSIWYQWPVIWKPMAFFFDYGMPEGWTSAISTFGNPAIWWVGLAALLHQLWRLIRGDSRRDPRLLLVVLGFAAQFLPWVLVPRTTFIYHYFASVPFLILCIGFELENMLARGKWKGIVVYLAVAGALFALFYPLASGLSIPIDFAELLNWLPSWHLFWR